MVEAEIIVTHKVGRKHGYKVVDSDVVSKALIRYKEEFVDEVVDDFMDTWMEIHP